MEQIIFLIITLVLSVQIFRKSGFDKLPWFFFGILFFSPSIAIVQTPLLTIPKVMFYSLFAATIFQYKDWFSNFRSTFPLKAPLILLLLLLLAVGITDDRLNFFYRIYRPFTYFLENFFVVFIFYYYTKTIEQVWDIYDILIKFFLLFGLYGISNYITRHNEYYAYLAEVYQTKDFANDYMVTGMTRFRVSSFSYHPIYYGLVLGIMIMIETFIFTSVEKIKNRTFYYIVFVLLFINLLMVNSRTPLFALVAGIGLYILFAVKLTKKIIIIFAIIGLGILTITLIPKASQIFDKSLSTLTGRETSDSESSTVEMREKQLAASEKIYSKSPIFGNGFNYITENLGFSSDVKKRVSDNDLQGFESYYYKLLIEQGLCGIIGNCIFFGWLLIWLFLRLFKVNKYGRNVVIFCIALTILFLLFILGTGDLGSFPLFMAILGMNIKMVNLSDKNIRYITIHELLKTQPI